MLLQPLIAAHKGLSSAMLHTVNQLPIGRAGRLVRRVFTTAWPADRGLLLTGFKPLGHAALQFRYSFVLIRQKPCFASIFI